MTELVGQKRRLSSAQKVKLSRLAWKKFVDPKLRKVELKARQGIIDAVMTAAAAIPKTELTVLRRHNLVVEITHIDLPYTVKATIGEKKFEVGGNTVTRAETQNLFKPREWDQFEPVNMQAATSGTRSGGHLNSGYSDGKHVDDLKLPATIEVPALASVFKGSGHDTHLRAESRSKGDEALRFNHSTFMRPKIAAAIEAYYLAAWKRMHEEGKLAMAACRLIQGVTHYAQVLEFFPEAAEIEKDLFDERLPKALSIVTISDEDKAALCKNMRQRGVKGSDLCKVA